MTSIWLHESDFRYVNLDVERYQKKYRLTLTNGNKYVFIKDKEDISDVNPFIPYILMEEGMNNVLVKSDDYKDILIYQGVNIQCLDFLNDNDISVEKLVDFETVELKADELNKIKARRLDAQLIEDEAKNNKVFIIGFIAIVIISIGVFWLM